MVCTKFQVCIFFRCAKKAPYRQTEPQTHIFSSENRNILDRLLTWILNKTGSQNLAVSSEFQMKYLHRFRDFRGTNKKINTEEMATKSFEDNWLKFGILSNFRWEFWILKQFCQIPKIWFQISISLYFYSIDIGLYTY